MPLAESLACIFISRYFDESNVYIYIYRRDVFLSRIAISYIYKRCLLHCKLTSIRYSNTCYYISNYVHHANCRQISNLSSFHLFNNSDLRYRLFLNHSKTSLRIFLHLSIRAQSFIPLWKKERITWLHTNLILLTRLYYIEYRYDSFFLPRYTFDTIPLLYLTLSSYYANEYRIDVQQKERGKEDGFARSCRGDCKRDRRGGRKSLISTSTFNRAVGASIIGGALAGAHDYQLATGAGRFRPRFPQLAAQRLVALRLRRKRDPGQELTVRSNDDSSSRFFSTCPPPPPYPTRSRWFRACVCHFEIGYRRPPTRLNRLDDWPFYAPFRLGSIVCRDSGLRGTVIRGGLHPSLRLTDFHSALWIPFFSLQYIYIFLMKNVLDIYSRRARIELRGRDCL